MPARYSAVAPQTAGRVRFDSDALFSPNASLETRSLLSNAMRGAIQGTCAVPKVPHVLASTMLLAQRAEQTQLGSARALRGQ